MTDRSDRTRREFVETLEGRVLFVAGDLDPDFGVGGITVADFGTPGVQGIDVAAFGTRAYAAGILAAPDATEGRVALAAFDRFGRPEESLGGDGTVITELTLPTGHRGEVLVQPDGKILVLNGSDFFGRQQYGVARFHPDGTIDRTFGGGDGKTVLPVGAGMALAPGGKIVVCGTGPVARLNPDGSPDTTFGGDGFVDVAFGGNDSGQRGVVDVAVMSDGRIVLVGADDNPDQEEGGWVAVAARLNPDGSFDSTFGTNGRTTADFGYFDNGYSAAVAGPNGEVLFGTMEGEVHARPQVIEGSAKIAAGTFFTRLDYDLPIITHMHVREDGKVVVSGRVSYSRYDDGAPETFLARYNPDGSLDPTFANGRAARPTSDKTELTPEGDVLALAGSGPALPLSSIDGVAVARYLGSDADNRTTLIPAEASQSLSGAVVSRAHGGYTGTGYVRFLRDSGARASYDFYAHHPGDHELRIRYSNGSGRLRIMEVNGRRVAFPPTGSWTRWREARVILGLPFHGQQFAERNPIEFMTTGRNGPNIDKVTVVRPDWPRTLQAEDATLAGAAVRSTHAGFEGRGYADFNEPNGSIEWTVESPVAREVAVTMRYANGSAAARVLPLEVNRTTPTFAFRPTGSWSTWRTETEYVRLEAGTNRLRLAAGPNGVGPNVDWVRIG